MPPVRLLVFGPRRCRSSKRFFAFVFATLPVPRDALAALSVPRLQEPDGGREEEEEDEEEEDEEEEEEEEEEQAEGERERAREG